jgi:Holliday junction resolvasome RuvABC endonuclease subunit
MIVLGIEPQARGVRIAVVEKDRNQAKLVLRETYEFGENEDRGRGLAQIRERLAGLMSSQAPSAVVIKSLEQEAVRRKKFINMGWFHSAEVRGVATEVATATNQVCILRDRATVARKLAGTWTAPSTSNGKSKVDELLEDESFWMRFGDLPKNYRMAFAYALSRLVEA